MSYPALVAGQIVTADGLNIDAAVVRLADGKVHTGALVDTNTTSSSYSAVGSANAQNVSVIGGRAYRADVQVSVASTVAGDRLRYSLWDGTVGSGTQLGAMEPLVRAETATTFRVQQFSFVWSAPADQTISNINLGHQRFSGTGTCTTRLEVTSFHVLVYDLGPASRIQNL